MSGRISVTYAKRGEWDIVLYSGPLNEDTAVHLPGLKAAIGGKVIFDFRNVHYINSNGVRSWVLFLREIRPGREIVFESCSPTVVTQLNMIPGFAEGVEVASVYVPWTCSECNHTVDVFFSARDYPKTSTEIPSRPCPKCGSTMSLGDSLEEYFEFAHR